MRLNTRFLVYINLLIFPTSSTFATVITTGSVTPDGLGPNNETISSSLTVGGDFTTAGNGTITISDGMSLTVNTTPFANIAPLAGSNGTITVTGTNGSSSLLRLEGTAGIDGAFLTVGRGGIGLLEIDGGAKVEIDSLGAPLARGVPGAGFPAGFQVARNAGSEGTINLSGTGSELRVTSDFAFGRIGTEGSGEMNITDNAALIFNGINNDLNVSSDLGAKTATSGVRSGVLNVNTGGSISGVLFLNIGASPEGTGILNLDGAQSSIKLSGACTPNCPPGFSFPNQGAFLEVGANQGTGEVNITNGAKFTIDSSGTPNAQFSGFTIGGSSILGPMGDGTINVIGTDSELLIKSDRSFFSVGRLENGTGTLNISDGGQVIIDNADNASIGFVGDRPGAQGTITIDGNTSLLDAGSFLGVGVDSRNLADAGNGTIRLVDEGTVLADVIQVGAGGNIVGNGTLAASSTAGAQVRVDPFGRIMPGLSTGQLTIDGDLILTGGNLVLEANSLIDTDLIIVLGDLILREGAINILLGFIPGPSDILEFFQVSGTTLVESTFTGINAFAASGSGVPIGTPVTVDINGNQFSASVVSTIPEPTTLALLCLGFIIIATRQRRVL